MQPPKFNPAALRPNRPSPAPGKSRPLARPTARAAAAKETPSADGSFWREHQTAIWIVGGMLAILAVGTQFWPDALRPAAARRDVPQAWMATLESAPVLIYDDLRFDGNVPRP